MLRALALMTMLGACGAPPAPREAAVAAQLAPSHEIVDAGPATPPDDVSAGADAGVVPPSVQNALALVAELRKTDAWVDPGKGLVSIVAGPGGDDSNVHTAVRLCGEAARERAHEVADEFEAQLRREWTEIEAADHVVPVCTNLVCAKPAYGEWDGDLTVRFARIGGTLVVTSSELVRDVPMRASAGNDFFWVSKKRRELAKKKGCPRR